MAGFACACAAFSAVDGKPEVAEHVSLIVDYIPTSSLRNTGFSVWQTPAFVNANLLVSNNQPESRMREIRQSGSVGGAPQTNAASLPQFTAGGASRRLGAQPLCQSRKGRQMGA